MITEDQLEKLAISWFQDTGYSYLFGGDIAPESATPYRNDFHEIIPTKECFEALCALNPGIPQEKIDEVVHRLKNVEGINTIYKNKAFHRMLLDGVPVEFERAGEKVQDFVVLIDF